MRTHHELSYGITRAPRMLRGILVLAGCAALLVGVWSVISYTRQNAERARTISQLKSLEERLAKEGSPPGLIKYSQNRRSADDLSGMESRFTEGDKRVYWRQTGSPWSDFVVQIAPGLPDETVILFQGYRSDELQVRRLVVLMLYAIDDPVDSQDDRILLILPAVFETALATTRPPKLVIPSSPVGIGGLRVLVSRTDWFELVSGEPDARNPSRFTFNAKHDGRDIVFDCVLQRDGSVNVEPNGISTTMHTQGRAVLRQVDLRSKGWEN